MNRKIVALMLCLVMALALTPPALAEEVLTESISLTDIVLDINGTEIETGAAVNIVGDDKFAKFSLLFEGNELYPMLLGVDEDSVKFTREGMDSHLNINSKSSVLITAILALIDYFDEYSKMLKDNALNRDFGKQLLAAVLEKYPEAAGEASEVEYDGNIYQVTEYNYTMDTYEYYEIALSVYETMMPKYLDTLNVLVRLSESIDNKSYDGDYVGWLKASDAELGVTGSTVEITQYVSDDFAYIDETITSTKTFAEGKEPQVLETYGFICEGNTSVSAYGSLNDDQNISCNAYENRDDDEYSLGIDMDMSTGMFNVTMNIKYSLGAPDAAGAQALDAQFDMIMLLPNDAELANINMGLNGAYTANDTGVSLTGETHATMDISNMAYSGYKANLSFESAQGSPLGDLFAGIEPINAELTDDMLLSSMEPDEALTEWERAFVFALMPDTSKLYASPVALEVVNAAREMSEQIYSSQYDYDYDYYEEYTADDEMYNSYTQCETYEEAQKLLSFEVYDISALLPDYTLDTLEVSPDGGVFYFSYRKNDDSGITFYGNIYSEPVTEDLNTLYVLNDDNTLTDVTGTSLINVYAYEHNTYVSWSAGRQAYWFSSDEIENQQQILEFVLAIMGK